MAWLTRSLSLQASGVACLLDTFLWRSKDKYLAREGETRTIKVLPCQRPLHPHAHFRR
jgi:hypothetical protein